MPLIIDSLRTQSEPPELMLINNGGFQTFGVKRTVHIPWNAGAWIRYPFAVYAETQYVMFLDDDLAPKDRDFVRDMRVLADRCRDGITGTHGRHIAPAPKFYTGGPDVNGPVEIVKGRCMMFDRALLAQVTLSNAIRPWPCAHEDIYLSMEIGRGRPVHWVDDRLRDRLVELPAPHAARDLPGHWEQRDAAVAWHLGKIQFDGVVDRAETIPHLCARSELAHLWMCAMKAPDGLPMVELGCYQGASAVVLCDAAYRKGSDITLIDLFQYATQDYGMSSVAVVEGNLQRARVPVMPRIIKDTSINVPDDLQQVGFLHIDTDHRREHLYNELEVWEPRMAPGGVIAFHDYCGNSPEMIPAIDDWANAHPEWKPLGLVRWMACFQKETPDA